MVSLNAYENASDVCSRDTFTGAYAADVVRQKQYGKDWDIKHAVELGCRAAAWTIKEIGAQESVPWLDEVAPGPR